MTARVSFICLAVLASLAAASAAGADPATAEALFRDGKANFDAGNVEAACAKWAESEKQDPQVGTLKALAICYEKLGRTASAWAAWNRLTFEAKNKHDDSLAQGAQQKAAGLEPTLSKLTIKASDTTTPGLLVRRDGEDIGIGALGSAIPVDPGSHVVQATAPGYEVWQTTITIGASHDGKTILIPELAKKSDGEGASTGRNPTKWLAGWVVGGVGVAGIGVGIATGVVALGDKSSATSSKTLCPNEKCTPAGRDKIDSANTMAIVSTIGFGVGIAAVGAGTFLLLTAGSGPAQEPSPAPAGPSARLVPSLGPQGGGLSVVGRF